jgi:hypothetical protein
MQAEIRVDEVREIRNLTMETVLDEIPQRVGENGTVVIVSHGTDVGLSLPLTSSSRRVHADSRVMGVLDSTRSDEEVAQVLLFRDPQGSGAQRVRDLRSKIRQVKRLGLDRVELRACNTGTSKSALRVAKGFFGAQALGAPSVRDAFFRLDPGLPRASERFWRRWLRKRPTHRVYQVPANGKVALAVRQTRRAAFQVSALVNKVSATDFWIDVYLARLHPAPSRERRGFPAHALWDDAAAFPLIFPGEDDFVRHIVHV